MAVLGELGVPGGVDLEAAEYEESVYKLVVPESVCRLTLLDASIEDLAMLKLPIRPIPFRREMADAIEFELLSVTATDGARAEAR
jgi:hypothetical protein